MTENESATERVGKHASTDRPDNPDRPEPDRRDAPQGPGRRRPVPPDDRMTTILPPVIDDRSPRRPDPIEEVKAALDGPPSAPLQRDALEEVKAALDGRAATSPRRDGPMQGRRPPEGPPPPPRRPDGPGGPADPATASPQTGVDWSWVQQINWLWVRRAAYLTAAALVLLPIVTFAMAYFIVDVPKPGNIRTNQVSTILASDGSEIAKIVPPEGNRVDVNINQVPVHVRQAVIAAEDRNFYSNPGFSFSGFARAVNNNLFGGGDLQGGSTITQQYVKNALVGSAQHGFSGLMRKAKELVIATKMSGEWSKDDVLQAYLNIIYFGRGAYGISAAAKAYFDKPVEQLTVSEGALLAALIRRPSSLDPAVDPKGAAERWNWVLDGMVETKALSPSDRAAQVFPATVPPDQARAQNQTTGPNGLIERQVTKELMELFNIDEQTLNTQGLQVTTTIDPKAQQAAEKAVSKYLDGQDPDMRAAAVSIDPHNGAIRAYYGGSDANGFDFAQAGLQTGSSFKVFALVAALRTRYRPGLPGRQLPAHRRRHQDHQRRRRELWDLQYRRGAEAFAQYRLLPADAQTQGRTAGRRGRRAPSRRRDQLPRRRAHAVRGRQGRAAQQRDRAGPVPNPAGRHGLGVRHAGRVRRLSPAASGAKGCQCRRPSAFRRRQPDKNNSGEQRIDKGVADNVTAAMQPIAGYSRGHNLAGGRPSAAKTGTVQLGDTQANKDAWMVGYTPSLSTAVWVGTVQDNVPLVTASGAEVYGSGLPSDIWKSTMDGALKGTSNESFPKPSEIGGYAGVPAAPPPPPAPPAVTVIQPTIEVAPGITIPVGPPTTITNAPPPPGGPQPGGPEPAGVPPGGPQAAPTATVTDAQQAERHHLTAAAGGRSA